MRKRDEERIARLERIACGMFDALDRFYRRQGQEDGAEGMVKGQFTEIPWVMDGHRDVLGRLEQAYVEAERARGK